MLPPALTKFATYMLRRRGIVRFNVGSRAVACKEGACIQRRPARRLPVLNSALASAGKLARWRLSAGVNAVQYRLVIWIGCRAGRDPDEKLQRSAKFDLRIAAGRRPELFLCKSRARSTQERSDRLQLTHAALIVSYSIKIANQREQVMVLRRFCVLDYNSGLISEPGFCRCVIFR